MRAAGAAAGEAEEERRGTLVALRRVSARLFFGDLEAGGGEPGAPACSLVFKRERCAALDALRRELRQGDVVLVRGVRDDAPAGPPTLLVTSCAVVLAWREASPGLAFVPRPAPKPVVSAAAAAAAPPGDAVEPPPAGGACKFWVNTGRCARGDGCAWLHARGGGAEWVSARRARRARLAAAAGDPHAGAAPAKAARAAAFADFLVATHGVEALRAGCGVLDVAGGGAGGVAFELHCRWGVPTTVVDPRPPQLCRRTAATLAAAAAAGGAAPHAASSPAHCAALFDVQLAKARFADAAAIVGMHPDQATDAVVDAALALGCPFAVVPCCVFPTLFADARRTSDGRKVTTREELVEYLLARAPGARAAWLPFQGANRVVFSPPLHALPQKEDAADAAA